MLKLRLLITTIISGLLLTGCGKDTVQYEMAYSAVTKLQTLIINPESVYIRHAFHGQPPVENYGTLILLLYSSLDETETRVNSYFGYEDENTYYLGVEATPLYDYRLYYDELNPEKINAHFDFVR